MNVMYSARMRILAWVFPERKNPRGTPIDQLGVNGSTSDYHTKKSREVNALPGLLRTWG